MQSMFLRALPAQLRWLEIGTSQNSSHDPIHWEDAFFAALRKLSLTGLVIYTGIWQREWDARHRFALAQMTQLQHVDVNRGWWPLLQSDIATMSTMTPYQNLTSIKLDCKDAGSLVDFLKLVPALQRIDMSVANFQDPTLLFAELSLCQELQEIKLVFRTLFGVVQATIREFIAACSKVRVFILAYQENYGYDSEDEYDTEDEVGYMYDVHSVQ